MRLRSLSFAAPLVFSSFLLTSNAFAAPGDTAAAELLFKQARELAQANKFEEACPKFEESQRLDPGMGTLYNLAQCFSHIGRHASSWAAFTEVADSAKAANQREREEDARQRAAAEEKLMSYVTVKPNATPGLEITRDGVLVGKAQLGSRIPVDEGEHAFKATAPKKLAWEKKITIRGEAIVEIPELVNAPIEAPRTDGSFATQDTVVVHERGGTQRIVGWSLVGVGGASLIVGGIFGARAISKNNASNSDGGCSASTDICSNADGPQLREQARSAGTLSSVFFVGGAVLAGAGIVTVLIAPKNVEEHVRETRTAFSPWFGSGVAGASLKGSF